jgi:hypothetical protein
MKFLQILNILFSMFAATFAALLAWHSDEVQANFGLTKTSLPAALQQPDMQDSVCAVDQLDGLTEIECERGNVIAFLPNVWGNEQMPVIFSVLACDMNRPVIHNNGGVACTFVGKDRMTKGIEKLKKSS